MKPQRKDLWIPPRPAVIVPSRRPIPAVRPPIIPMRRIIPVRSSVSVDVTGTHQAKTASGTSLTYAFTVSSGLTNSAVVFCVIPAGLTGTACTFTSPTYNSVSCPQIITVNDTAINSQVTWFGMVAPTGAGTSHNFSVTVSIANLAVYVYGVSFQGVNQTGGTTTFANSTSNSSTSNTAISITVTTASGDYTIAACDVGTGAATLTSTLTSTGGGFAADWTDNTDATVGAAGKFASTSTSTGYTGHNSANDFGCIAGFDIVAAATGTVNYTGWDDGQNQTYPRGSMVGWRSAALAKGDDGIQSPFVNFIKNDWDTHPHQPQPPPTPRGRDAAILVGDQGTQATFIRFLQNDWDTHPFQPPHASPERRYAAVVQKDEGIEFPFIRFLPNDWDTHPPQPPHPRPERVGALFGGDQGSEAQFIRFFPYGWEIPSPQPPHPRPERAGAIMPNEPGIEAKFVPPVTVVWGWESPPASLVRRVRPVSEFGDQGILSQFIQFIAYGWEVSPFQPSHPRVEKAASWLTGDQGIEAPFVPPAAITWGWEIQPHQPALRPERRYPGLKGSSQFPIFSTWINMGWEIPSPQPPHPRPERAGAIATSEPGIEFPYVFVPTTTWGWEVAAPLLRRRLLTDPEIGDQGTEASLINWLNAGWEIPSFQPQHPRPERAGAIMPSEPGIEAVYVPPAPIIWGWEIAPHQPVINVRGRYPGMRGSAQFPIFSTWINGGWEVPSFQPSHPRIERSGAIALSDQGIQFPFVPPVTIVWGYESASQTLRSPPHNSAALWGSSDFAAFTFQPYGWEIPPFQPSHPRFERAGAIAIGDQGPLFPPVTPTIFIEGWQILPFQPPHPRPERNAAWMLGDQGTQSQFNVFLPWGWEIPAPF